MVQWLTFGQYFLGYISCAGLDVYYWTVQYCPTTYSLSPYNLVNDFTRTGWILISYSIHGWFYGQNCHFSSVPNIIDIWRYICPFHIFFASQKWNTYQKYFFLNMKYMRKAFQGGVNVPWVHSAPNNFLLIYHV